jgi:hypothetical protein
MMAWWAAWRDPVFAAVAWLGVAYQWYLLFRARRISRESRTNREHAEQTLALCRDLLADTPQQQHPVVQTNGHPPHPKSA